MHFVIIYFEGEKVEQSVGNYQNYVSPENLNQWVKVNMLKCQVLFYTTVQ